MPPRRPPRPCSPPTSCRATSRSSWTATGAGPAPAACPSSRGTRLASRRSADSSSTPSGAASRCSRCTPSAARTGRGPTTRCRACSSLLGRAIANETDELRAQGVRVRMLGRLDELPDETRASIADALERTAGGARLQLNIAWNYAGRTELVDAFRRIAASGVSPEAVDERTISDALYTGGLPDPDLADPHRRRAAGQQLPHLAVGLRRAGLHRLPVAGLRRGGPRRRSARVRAAHPPVRPLTANAPNPRAVGAHPGAAARHRAVDRDPGHRGGARAGRAPRRARGLPAAQGGRVPVAVAVRHGARDRARPRGRVRAGRRRRAAAPRRGRRPCRGGGLRPAGPARRAGGVDCDGVRCGVRGPHRVRAPPRRRARRPCPPTPSSTC